MSSLASEQCVACRRDAPQVTAAEIEELRPQVPDWELVERDGIPRLERVLRFANFAGALAFTNRVGVLAEAQSLDKVSGRLEVDLNLFASTQRTEIPDKMIQELARARRELGERMSRS